MRRCSARPGRAALAAVATAVMLVAGCSVLPGSDESETVLIGVDLELTGDNSEFATVYQNALELQVTLINDQELLDGRQVELEILDNRSDPATSAANVATLAENPDVTAVITGACGDCAVAGAEVAEQQGIPLIALAGTDEAVQPIEERQYTFKLGPNATDNASALVSEFQSAEEEVETIAVISADDSYGEAGQAQMQEAAARAGIEVVVSETVTAEDESAQAAANAVIAYEPPFDPADLPDEGEVTGPDAVVVWAPAALANPFTAALRGTGYEAPLYLDAIAADQLFLPGATSDTLEGATLVFTESLVIDRVIATSPSKVARQNWFNSYTAEYGTFHAYSVFAADAMQLIVDTIAGLDSTDRDAIRSGFERTQLDGIAGPLRISPNNHSGFTSLGLTTLVASGGRWQAAG